MRASSREPVLYAVLAGMFLLVVGWWMVFFSQQGDFLIEHLDREGAGLTPEQTALVYAEASRSNRMLLFEAAFLGLLGLSGMALVWRSMRRELLLHRQQRDFLSAVTHELRSPIAAARLQVESLSLGRVPDAKVARYLERTLTDLDRLSRTVDQLLEAARATSGRTALSLQPIELVPFVQRSVARLREAERGGAEIHVDPEPGVELERGPTDGEGPVAVQADANALETIVENLISNAVKYGGEPPWVRIRVLREERHAVLEVRDRGPGLSDEDAGRLFDPFVRGGHEIVQRRPGIGLGLFLVSELVREMDGTVRARNLEGESGLAVRVRLPLAGANGKESG